MSLFLDKSISDIILLINNKKINEKEILTECQKFFDLYNDKYNIWNEFSLDKNFTFLGSFSNKLKGIPFGAKDIFNTISFKTEMGSPIWKNFNAGNNSRVIDMLLCHGAHIVGKTNTSEFAVHEESEVLNPHNIKKTPGTSSAGSAVAVLTGNVPFALATQSAGSIIRPASFCGVWGFKPSYGLVPRTGILKTCDTLDTVGFFTSHQKNLRVILDNIRLEGKNYPYIYDNIDKKKIKKKIFKIAFIKTYAWKYTKDYIKSSVLNFIDKISFDKNIILEEIYLPLQDLNFHELHEKIYYKSLYYYFINEIKKKGKISNSLKKIFNIGENISETIYLNSLKKQEILQNEFNKILSPYDAVVTFSTSSSAVGRNETPIKDNSLIWTLAHLPAINSHLNFCSNNMPFGIQFTGKKWNDYVILDFLDYLVDQNYLDAKCAKINKS